MAFKKKTWKDRMVEYAGRRKLTNISTNQSIICDVARSEGTVSQEGDALSSQNLNDLEQRIEDGFTEVKQTTDTLNQNLGGFSFKEEGGKKYVRGADAVWVPFSSPAIISMIQLTPTTQNYAGNTITLDVSDKTSLYIESMQSWYDDANISIDADGTTLFSKKQQTGGANRVDTTEIGDIDVSQYNLITINFSVVSKNGQGWGKLNNIIVS